MRRIPPPARTVILNALRKAQGQPVLTDDLLKILDDAGFTATVNNLHVLIHIARKDGYAIKSKYPCARDDKGRSMSVGYWL